MATAVRDIDTTDTAALLIGFAGELSAPLLPTAERTDFLMLFALLSSLALGARANAPDHAALCSDGTPLELSLALDDRGHHALRFVCDVGGPPPAWDGSEGRYYRELADKVAPRFDGRAETLDRLFAQHLSGAPAESRFKVWFGGGAAPGTPLTALIYFNSEWLTAAEFAAIITPLIGADAAATYSDWARAIGVGCAGVAYDFDTKGLRKTKLYLRLDGTRVRALESTLRLFPGDAGARLSGMFEKSLGAGQRGGTMVALGFSTTSPAPDASVYFHLPSWGVPDFAGLTPVVQRLLGNWGTDFDGGFGGGRGEGPQGCDPTLLSLSESNGRERLAIYFKPQLGGGRAG